MAKHLVTLKPQRWIQGPRIEDGKDVVDIRQAHRKGTRLKRLFPCSGNDVATWLIHVDTHCLLEELEKGRKHKKTKLKILKLY